MSGTSGNVIESGENNTRDGENIQTIWCGCLPTRCQKSYYLAAEARAGMRKRLTGQPPSRDRLLSAVETPDADAPQAKICSRDTSDIDVTFLKEKIGRTMRHELDVEFISMEKQVRSRTKHVEDIVSHTHELLQPNPASRAKMVAMKGMSKIRSHHTTLHYPQPEGQLGECMTKYGQELGEESLLAQALMECGETFCQLADVRYCLDDNVRLYFIEPLLNMQSMDLREIDFHWKKLSNRRLQYDCLKRKQQKNPVMVSEHKLVQAAEKFEESKLLAETAMQNLLDNEVQQLSQVAEFVDAEVAYHQQSSVILKALQDGLKHKCSETAKRPHLEHVLKPATTSCHSSSLTTSPNCDSSSVMSECSSEFSPPGLPAHRGGSGACAEALYDFQAETDMELAFHKGDKISLLARINDNWFVGSVRGRTGLFPAKCVQVIVDLL